MELLFEKSVAGRRAAILPDCDVPAFSLPESQSRQKTPRLPELSETDVSRHYSALERRSHGVNNGFYPLGSCTMKYNPRINEVVASMPGFADIHPLQPAHTVKGCMEVLDLAQEYLCAITGMDAMTFQPAAGAHGELTGIMLIKKYHQSRADSKRTKILVPDSAHGTNPATAVMCGMKAVNIPSGPDGCVDIEKLRAAVGEDTAGLMLTNPNTVGLFEKDILEITKIVHDAGGLVYYDGANLNAIMGVIRPGDMGFDCVHLNLHKTFSTPHGGGGPGSGAVGCKENLVPYLPAFDSRNIPSQSIGKVKAFYGNFLVVLRALTYVMTLGREGITQSAKVAVLNANYLKKLLEGKYKIAFDCICMHEFVISMEAETKSKHVTAMDIAKAMLDYGMHPPTMYFPMIVPEALMVEPTETESKETLDLAAEVLLSIYDMAMEDPEAIHQLPLKTPIRRPDEVKAAREPVLRYSFEA